VIVWLFLGCLLSALIAIVALGWFLLYSQGVQIMSNLSDVKADLETLRANVAELVREVGVLVSAGPGLVTQEQLDELDASIKAISDTAKAADPNP
jgi:hypothetical protein